MTTVNKKWLLLTDLHGIVRGKLIPEHNRLPKKEVTHTEFSGVFANDMQDCPIPGMEYIEDVNITAFPSSTPVKCPWSESCTYVMCNAFVENNIQSKLCPRTLLGNAVESARNMNYVVKCGVELEWTLLDKNNDPVSNLYQTYSMLHYENENISNFLSDLVEKTNNFPTTIEALHVESGKGMYEAALSPSDPLTTADSVQLYRMTIKRLAKNHGMKATFAPKSFTNTAGCGMHIHISIEKLDGSSGKSVLFTSFLAGLLYHMESSAVMLLPNVQSFSRTSTGEFWTSSSVSYAVDSRAAAVRLVQWKSNTGSARLEIRVAGGDANPYLSLYYCIRAGMWGVEKGLDISLFGKPGEDIAELPKSLYSAAMLFIDGESPARSLYGDAFVDTFGTVRLHEGSTERQDGWDKNIF